MISYKVLMTLTVIFIISSEADDRVQNCKVILAKLGITDDYGLINHCIVRQFKDINHFRNSLERNGIAFVHFQEEYREMTVNEEILTKFFEDNLGKDLTLHNLHTPLKYCQENINDKSGLMGCLRWMSRFRAMSRLRAKYEASKTKEYKKCEEEITKEYERIKIVTPTINVDGVEYPEHEKLVNQTYCKENIFENFIVSYNLMYGCYSDESIREIDEIVQLWPGSKRGFLQRQLLEFEALNKFTVFLTKTKWCMKYYDQKPIQESTSGTSPP